MNIDTLKLPKMKEEHSNFYLANKKENKSISIIDCEKMFAKMTISDKLKDSVYQILMNLKSLALQSNAEKRKVSAIIIKNGMTYGGKNYCQLTPNTKNKCELIDGNTSPFTIHAEEDAIFNFFNENPLPLNLPDYFELDELVMYTTFSPCHNCTRMIVQSGVKYLNIINVHKENFEQDIYNEKEIFNISPLTYLINHGIKINYLINSDLNNLKELK